MKCRTASLPFLHSTGTNSIKDFLSFRHPFSDFKEQLSKMFCFPEESRVHRGWQPVCSQAPGSRQGIIHRNVGNT